MLQKQNFTAQTCWRQHEHFSEWAILLVSSIREMMTTLLIIVERFVTFHCENTDCDRILSVIDSGPRIWWSFRDEWSSPWCIGWTLCLQNATIPSIRHALAQVTEIATSSTLQNIPYSKNIHTTGINSLLFNKNVEVAFFNSMGGSSRLDNSIFRHGGSMEPIIVHTGNTLRSR